MLIKTAIRQALSREHSAVDTERISNEQPSVGSGVATFWVYVQNWAARAITLLVFFVLARLLSPEEFGTFTVAMIFVMTGEIFVEHILAHAIIQRDDLTHLHLNSAFWSIITFAAILAVSTFFIAPWYAGLSKNPNSASIIMALIPIFFFMGLSSIPAALLRRRLNYKILARRTVLANIISGITAIVVAFCGFGIWAFVSQLLVFYLVGLIVLWCNETWRPNLSFSFSALRELLGYSGRITFVKVLELLETRGMELIIARAFGVAPLGNYALASKAQQAANQLLAAPLGEALISIFSRQQSNRELLVQLLLSRSVMVVSIIVPAFVFIAATADKFIPLVFSEKWTGAVMTFQILCVLASLRVITYVYVAALQAIGAADAIVRTTIVRLLGCIVSLPILLQSFSIEGAAFGLLFGQILAIPILINYLRNHFCIKISSILVVLVRPLIVLAMTLVVGYLSMLVFAMFLPELYTFFLSLLIGIIVFFVTIVSTVDLVRDNMQALFKKIRSVLEKRLRESRFG
jgi:O-antigen/teichoic acid export membrane protein